MQDDQVLGSSRQEALARDVATSCLHVQQHPPIEAQVFSPYRLMYGREPTLPVDQLLSRVDGDWEKDFVKSQADDVTRMHAVVERNLKKAADVNKRHENGLKEKDIKVGQSILLRSTAFTGRHKLSDKFHRDPYVVISINEEGDVYDIRPTHGGPVKRVNKKLLLIHPRANEVPADPPDFWMPYREDEEIQDSAEDADEDDDLPLWYFPECENMPDSRQPTTRRSNRPTKGIHSNPAPSPPIRK